MASQTHHTQKLCTVETLTSSCSSQRSAAPPAAGDKNPQTPTYTSSGCQRQQSDEFYSLFTSNLKFQQLKKIMASTVQTAPTCSDMFQHVPTGCYPDTQKNNSSVHMLWWCHCEKNLGNFFIIRTSIIIIIILTWGWNQQCGSLTAGSIFGTCSFKVVVPVVPQQWHLREPSSFILTLMLRSPLDHRNKLICLILTCQL